MIVQNKNEFELNKTLKNYKVLVLNIKVSYYY
jgi:hypothetical protein